MEWSEEAREGDDGGRHKGRLRWRKHADGRTVWEVITLTVGGEKEDSGRMEGVWSCC